MIVAKSKEVKTGCSNSQEWTNLAEASKEGYGSKRAVLPMMMQKVKSYPRACLINDHAMKT
jgi:hypothetical protein